MARPAALPPSIDLLLGHADARALIEAHGRDRVKAELRAAAERYRESAREPEGAAGEALARRLVADAAESLAARRPAGPARVVNGTGVLLHTNLGRAPLSEAAKEAVIRASGYSNLELDLATGGRGKRGEHVRPLLLALYAKDRPGVDALAVTNAAAALLLALDTVANGHPVAVSRGELVAIGGDFRIPSILAKSGASLREVGTTNRTTLEDYKEALDEGSKAILKVHPSNYRIVGFTEEVTIEALAKLARAHSVPLVFDSGSGAVDLLPEVGPAREELPFGALEAGADLVCFSGDKLLGGPQAGVLIGSAALVERATRNPLARALRPDKLALAALAATLDLHLSGRTGEVPLYRMLGAGLESLGRRAEAIASEAERLGLRALPVDSTAVAGGGSGAESTIPSRAVSLEWPGHPVEALAERLRLGSLPVIGRIEGGRLLLDLRTVAPEEDGELLGALHAAVRSSGP